MDGLLVIDKPAGLTSHDVVARMRRVLGESRVGHTGTLDPAATGVLPLVIGRATRLARFLASSDKEYQAVITLGVRTTTYDAEGDPVGLRWAGPLPSRDEIERVLDRFRGRLVQQPPAFSAKKIGGTRSYKLARAAGRESRHDGGAGKLEAAPKPVAVTVRIAEIVSSEGDHVTIRVVCSAGFYVRSLANDLGEALGTGAHLAALRRTRSGDYGLDDAIALEAAERDSGAARASVLPLERLLTGWPFVVLTDDGMARVRHGRDVAATGTQGGASAEDAGPRVRLLDANGRLIGIAERGATGVLHPAVVFV